MDDTSRKAHRKPKSGVKADKKKDVKQRKQGITKEVRAKNPKAFVFSSAHAALKSQRRNLDLEQKRVNLPVLDQSGTADEVPPIVIAVVGPPGVGKSTLIRSLIKNYTRFSVGEIKGPITIVASKRRRITFVECNNDLNSMIDTAKVADLVLLLIDASFGFEMETFEFLNILQTHGFPKVIGVLTHLDGFKNNKRLKKTKKKLKDRFWTEIYQGAKLFYLSGLIHGKYPKQEIHNLARFISVAKFTPLSWRNSHPYVYVDRFEDTTDVEQIKHTPKENRSVCLYGYVRGTYFKPHMKVHLPGVGDFRMKSVTPLPDPCPLPDDRKRVLNGKDRLIYSPMSDIGNILYDKDAIIINIPDNKVAFSKLDKQGRFIEKDDDESEDDRNRDDSDDENRGSEDEDEIGEGVSMVRKLQNNRVGLDEKMEDSEVSLFSKGAPIKLTNKPLSQKRLADLDHVNELSDSEYYDEPASITTTTTNGTQSKKVEVKEVVDGRERRKVKFVQLKKTPTDLGSDEEAGEDDEDEEDDDDQEEDVDQDDEEEEELEDGEDQLQFDDESGDEMLSDEEYYDPSLERDGEDEDEDEEDEEEEDEDEDNEQEENGESSRWKENMLKIATGKPTTKISLAKLIYGDPLDKKKGQQKDEDEESDEEEFFKVKKGGFGQLKLKKDLERDETGINRVETSKNIQSILQTNSLDEHVLELLISRFVDKDDLENVGAVGREDAADDQAMFGDFEDLETGQKFGPSTGNHEHGDDSDNSDDEGSKKGGKKKEDGKDNEKDENEEEDDFEKSRRKLREKKEREIKRINAKYEEGEDDYASELNEAAKKQRAINEAEFANDDKYSRMQYAGFPIGIYVRIEFESVPYEFCQHFDPRFPVLVGGLQTTEENLGMVNVKIKKHRWHKKVLKSNDPLVISMGWRRFQTMMLYSIQDINGRNRMLKYTPEHMHCQASFYGPITPPGTGFIAFTNLKGSQASFRVSANGIVLDLDSTINVVKKLKLTGRPKEILKKTAFIQGMFSSRLEVAKFVGATIRTVSGIRGQIKKPMSSPEGCFRATFEDKILMSDIVFLRTWYTISPTKFYTPVTNMLSQEKEWQGMKTVGQLRFEKGLRAPIKEDSVYREVERQQRHFRDLEIPANLQSQLPFDLKPKGKVLKNKADALLNHRAVVMEPHEKRVADLMNKLELIKQKKLEKEQERKDTKHKEYLEKKKKENREKEDRLKEQKKRKFKMDALGKGKKKQKQLN